MGAASRDEYDLDLGTDGDWAAILAEVDAELECEGVVTDLCEE